MFLRTGAFFSSILSEFLKNLVALQLLCLIVYQAVQFVENQFIYPHVVGGSVGLAPLWTLLAALLGGKLFGLVGIVFFIPLMAVALQLVHERTARQLAEKHLAREDLIE